MADLTLQDGREITVDLSQISLREYRALLDPKQTQAEEDATGCKVFGLTPDEYLDLSMVDMKRLWKVLFKKAREPLEDPNLPSAST